MLTHNASSVDSRESGSPDARLDVQGVHNVPPSHHADLWLACLDNLSVRFASRNTAHLSASNRSNPNLSGHLAVSDVSLKVYPRQVVGIVGESGSGKSVTTLAMLRLLAYQSRVTITGSIRLRLPASPNSFPAQTKPRSDWPHSDWPHSDWIVHDIARLPERTLASLRKHHVGMVFQDARDALDPLQRIQQQLHHAIPSSIRNAQTIHKLLLRVGLDDAERIAKSYPHQISGGQRQRVLIAMAVAKRPSLLIADEPTSSLDAHHQRRILELLVSLQRETGMGMILVDHNLELLKTFADWLVVMRHGKVVEQGPASDIAIRPTHPYTQHLLQPFPHMQLSPVAPEKNPIVLDAHDVTVMVHRGPFWRRQSATLLAPCGLHVRRGETLGILGGSGSGKTTLALALLRLIPARGIVLMHGHNMMTLPPRALRALRHQAQIVFQDPFSSLSPRMTVASIIGEGLRILQPSWDVARIDANVCAMMERLSMDPAERGLYPHEFSGGQRQRIALARALIVNPDLLILDEPTSALDSVTQTAFLTMFSELQQERAFASIFITHHLGVLRAISHRVLVLDHGVVVEEGNTDTVLNSPQHPVTRTLLDAISPTSFTPSARSASVLADDRR